MKPQVAIGLPVYNSGATLLPAIQSVLAQTFSDWELIICDDRSTDDSLAIALAVQDERIRVIQNPRNFGLSASLHSILEASGAPLIARMDSDDLLHPERISLQAQVFASRDDVEVVSTGAYVIDDENQVIGGRRRGFPATTTREVLVHNGPIHASIMARRGWCEKNRYLGEFMRGEDLELWARALPNTVHTHLSRRLYFIREDPNVNVAKYCRTIAAHNSVIRSFVGKQGVTSPFASALVSRSYFRVGAYRLAGVLGLQSRIASRRVEQLSSIELLNAQRTVDGILAMPVEVRESVVAHS